MPKFISDKLLSSQKYHPYGTHKQKSLSPNPQLSKDTSLYILSNPPSTISSPSIFQQLNNPTHSIENDSDNAPFETLTNNSTLSITRKRKEGPNTSDAPYDKKLALSPSPTLENSIIDAGAIQIETIEITTDDLPQQIPNNITITIETNAIIPIADQLTVIQEKSTESLTLILDKDTTINDLFSAMSASSEEYFNLLFTTKKKWKREMKACFTKHCFNHPAEEGIAQKLVSTYYNHITKGIELPFSKQPRSVTDRISGLLSCLHRVIQFIEFYKKTPMESFAYTLLYNALIQIEIIKNHIDPKRITPIPITPNLKKTFAFTLSSSRRDSIPEASFNKLLSLPIICKHNSDNSTTFSISEDITISQLFSLLPTGSETYAEFSKKYFANLKSEFKACFTKYCFNHSAKEDISQSLLTNYLERLQQKDIQQKSKVNNKCTLLHSIKAMVDTIKTNNPHPEKLFSYALLLNTEIELTKIQLSLHQLHFLPMTNELNKSYQLNISEVKLLKSTPLDSDSLTVVTVCLSESHSLEDLFDLSYNMLLSEKTLSISDTSLNEIKQIFTKVLDVSLNSITLKDISPTLFAKINTSIKAKNPTKKEINETIVLNNYSEKDNFSLRNGLLILLIFMYKNSFHEQLPYLFHIILTTYKTSFSFRRKGNTLMETFSDESDQIIILSNLTRMPNAISEVTNTTPSHQVATPNFTFKLSYNVPK